MKGWQATLALIGGLVLGVGLWFGFMWLGAPLAPAPEHVASAEPAPAPELDAPVAAPEAPPAPTGLTRATADGEGADGPPHAYTIPRQADDLAALLAAAPSIGHGNKGPTLYIVAFHGCPACAVVREREVPALETAGVDVRWIVYARRDRDGEVRSSPEELAVVAELTLSRNSALFDRWINGAPEAVISPRVEGSPERMAAIEAGRALVDRLNEIVTDNALPFAVPALFWKEGAAWRSYIGYDAATFAEVRAGLGPAPASP